MFFRVLKNKIFLCLILFSITFIIFALAGRDVWFSLDDLGNIINGLIHSFKDFIRVFSQDERVYICPINYTTPKANIISGFYRPLQHIPFTIIHYFFNFNAYAYYLTNVFFHAINAALIFYLFSFYISIFLALLAGFVYAFCPILDWMTWVSCLHNFMAVFFMLLSLICFRRFCIEKRWQWQGSAAFMFLLSIISRENTILLGIWLWCACFILGSKLTRTFKFAWFDTPAAHPECARSACIDGAAGTHHERCIFDSLILQNGRSGLWQRFKSAWQQTWMFFGVYGIYFLLRLNAFGVASLDRTVNNLLLKFPVLQKIFFAAVQPAQQVGVQAVVQSAAVAQSVAAQAVAAQAAGPGFAHDQSWIWNKLQQLVNSFICWASSLLNLNLADTFTLIFVLCLIGFVIFAYRKHFSLLIALTLGFLFFLWPGIVACPNPRYISGGYPFLIFIFFFAVARKPYGLSSRGMNGAVNPTKPQGEDGLGYNIFSLLIVFLCLFYIYSGISKNVSGIKQACYGSQIYKKRFENFFQQNSFDSDVNFIVMGPPFVSDIQNVFQAFLNNLNLKVAYLRESTIAQHGIMGCSGDYRSEGVPSTIEPVIINGKRAFRFISHDKEHCCWWMNFSHFPLKWSAADRAYIWTDKPLEVGVWYDFSMGKFIINDRVGQHFITDVTFIIDDCWVDNKTVFVVWDSMSGRYVAWS